MTRHLLGGKEITHDPGPEGDSGEGDAALVMVFLVISLAGGILIYEKFFKKQENGKFNDGDYVPDPKDVESASAPSNTTDEKNSVALTSEMTMTAQEQADAEAQAKWLRPTDDQVWKKVALFFLVMYCLWVFLLTLSLMGSGFKLLGGKDSAKMFDFVDNPVSGLMIGILATVLVQSSSTTTIIVSLVGANELSVRNAVFMIMGANIGTSA